MTIDEASERYSIPLEILHEYESWGLCDTVKKVMGVWQYDDEDIEYRKRGNCDGRTIKFDNGMG